MKRIRDSEGECSEKIKWLDIVQILQNPIVYQSTDVILSAIVQLVPIDKSDWTSPWSYSETDPQGAATMGIELTEISDEQAYLCRTSILRRDGSPFLRSVSICLPRDCLSFDSWDDRGLSEIEERPYERGLSIIRQTSFSQSGGVVVKSVTLCQLISEVNVPNSNWSAASMPDWIRGGSLFSRRNGVHALMQSVRTSLQEEKGENVIFARISQTQSKIASTYVSAGEVYEEPICDGKIVELPGTDVTVGIVDSLTKEWKDLPAVMWLQRMTDLQGAGDNDIYDTIVNGLFERCFNPTMTETFRPLLRAAIPHLDTKLRGSPLHARNMIKIARDVAKSQLNLDISKRKRDVSCSPPRFDFSDPSFHP